MIYEQNNPWQQDRWERMWKFAENNRITIPHSSDVLDIGGGSGEKARTFIEKFCPHQVDLIDVSPVAVQKANGEFKRLYPDNSLYRASQIDISDTASAAEFMRGKQFNVIMDSLAMQFLTTEHLKSMLQLLQDHSIPRQTLLLHQSMAPRFKSPNQNVSAVASLTDEQYELFSKFGFYALAQESFHMRNGGQESRMTIFRATE